MHVHVIRTAVLAAGIGAALPNAVRAEVTPASEEVRAMVARGLDVLQREEDPRLGAHCLAALAFLKTGSPASHPIIQRTVRACREAAYQPFPIEDVYSNGLAVIFLCELDPNAHREEIGRYLASLYARQKPHGGWGYDERETGDTSQTQYAVLGLWTAHRSGFRVEREVVLKALNWLMRTQDPGGAWGYQGHDPGTFERVRQTQTSVSMLSAGLGSTLMCAHMFGIADTVESPVTEQLDLPPAVKRVAEERRSAPPLEGAAEIDRERLGETVRLARAWMDENFEIDATGYRFYYLYALERYKSFEELVTGERDESPPWYQQGVEVLKEHEVRDYGWAHGGGVMADTSFAILFLIRSTQRSLSPGGIGDGLLVGGRGLPQNIAQATVRRGRLIADETSKSVDELVRILEDPTHPQHEELLKDASGLRRVDIGDVSPDDVPRLTRLIRGGEPLVRLVSVQALAARDHLDDVPVLIYALSDPDRRVVLAARDALRRISRRIEGFGLGDAYTDRQRHDAIQKWKAWYLTVRPDGVLD